MTNHSPPVPPRPRQPPVHADVPDVVVGGVGDGGHDVEVEEGGVVLPGGVDPVQVGEYRHWEQQSKLLELEI